MSKAHNGDRRASAAITFLAEKIGRVIDVNSDGSQIGGIILGPGVAKSNEEYEASAAENDDAM
jgi:hypothetical protein